jgi:hypothetical protein
MFLPFYVHLRPENSTSRTNFLLAFLHAGSKAALGPFKRAFAAPLETHGNANLVVSTLRARCLKFLSLSGFVEFIKIVRVDLPIS